MSDPFKEHLEWAHKVVSSWPKWKQNLLGNSPTHSEPVETVDKWIADLWNTGDENMKLVTAKVTLRREGDTLHVMTPTMLKANLIAIKLMGNKFSCPESELSPRFADSEVLAVAHLCEHLRSERDRTSRIADQVHREWNFVRSRFFKVLHKGD